jgi:hypothetical protein
MTNAWFKVGDVPSTSSFSEAPDFGDVNSAFSCGEVGTTYLRVDSGHVQKC